MLEIYAVCATKVTIIQMLLSLMDATVATETFTIADN